MNLGESGPILWLIDGQPTVHRVDAEGKESIELGVESLKMWNQPSQQIPVKCFQMADVENNAMPLGDWAFVQGAAFDEREQFVYLSTCFAQGREQLVVEDAMLSSKHLVFLPSDDSISSANFGPFVCGRGIRTPSLPLSARPQSGRRKTNILPLSCWNRTMANPILMTGRGVWLCRNVKNLRALRSA